MLMKICLTDECFTYVVFDDFIGDEAMLMDEMRTRVAEERR
jgi:hypothetical protein